MDNDRPRSLEDLPEDVLLALLPLDPCPPLLASCLSVCSRTLSASCSAPSLWEHLYGSRYGAAAAPPPVDCRSALLSRRTAARRRLASARSAKIPPPPREYGHARRRNPRNLAVDAYVPVADFLAARERFAVLVVPAPAGHAAAPVPPADAVEWASEATRDPVAVLALVSALLDDGASPGLGRIRPCGRPDGAVSVRYTTWSSARDCRGFRARDDVHFLDSSVGRLARTPHHPIWGVLRRGVHQEVTSVELKVVL